MAHTPRKSRTLPRKKWTNPLAWAVWNQRRLNKIRGEEVPPISCRYFYDFDGFDDYIGLPEIILLGDSRIKFSVDTPQGSGAYKLLSDLVGSSFRLVLFGKSHPTDAGRFEVVVNGSTPAVYVTAGMNSSVMSMEVSIIGGSAEVYVNGVSYGSVNVSGSITIAKISDALSNFSGRIWDLSVEDAGTLIRSYAINDNATTIADSVSGQNGTLINGTTNQWFQQCTLETDWTIGTDGADLRGFTSIIFGGLSPNVWNTNTLIEELTVDTATNLIVLKGSDDLKIGGALTVDVSTTGTPSVTLTWNGSTQYEASDATFTTYVDGQLGNSIPIELIFTPLVGGEYTFEYTDEYT